METYNSTIPGKIESVRSVVRDITSYLTNSYGIINETTLFELKVILNELILNAIRHGNKEDCTKAVKIKTAITKDKYVIFLIEDEGEGYDYKCITQENKNPFEIAEICGLNETGRGLFIVKNLCDKMKFNSKGNKVLVLKKL